MRIKIIMAKKKEIGASKRKIEKIQGVKREKQRQRNIKRQR